MSASEIKIPSRYLTDPLTTACFSGHRPEKLPFNINHAVSEDTFKTFIYLHIHEAYEAGYRTFITGMARGFDIIAAQTVLKYRRRFSVKDKISLIGVSPFSDEIHRLYGQDLYNYQMISESCDEMIYLRRDYKQGCFHTRNRFMVDHSSLLICACTDPKSGTGSTIKYAMKKGLRIDNIDVSDFPDLSDVHYKLPENGIWKVDRKKRGTVTYVNLPYTPSSLNDTRDDEKKQ